ncbi:hypothetical protein ACWC9T_38555 [Kitasatospora sp. NPDC001159]
MAQDHPSSLVGTPALDAAVIEKLKLLRERNPLDDLDEKLRELVASHRRLKRLLDAVATISSDMDTGAVLRHIVAAGCDLVDARYGALGVLGENGQFVDLITAGVDEKDLKDTFGTSPSVLASPAPRPIPIRSLADVSGLFRPFCVDTARSGRRSAEPGGAL